MRVDVKAGVKTKPPPSPTRDDSEPARTPRRVDLSGGIAWVDEVVERRRPIVAGSLAEQESIS